MNYSAKVHNSEKQKRKRIVFKTNVETRLIASLQGFAERARFELAEELPLRQFSKLVVSATHPSLRLGST